MGGQARALPSPTPLGGGVVRIAESGIGVLKAVEGFGQLSRCGVYRARGELLGKVISHNALKIVSLRKQRYEEEHRKEEHGEEEGRAPLRDSPAERPLGRPEAKPESPRDLHRLPPRQAARLRRVGHRGQARGNARPAHRPGRRVDGRGQVAQLEVRALLSPRAAPGGSPVAAGVSRAPASTTRRCAPRRAPRPTGAPRRTPSCAAGAGGTRVVPVSRGRIRHGEP